MTESQRSPAVGPGFYLTAVLACSALTELLHSAADVTCATLSRRVLRWSGHGLTDSLGCRIASSTDPLRGGFRAQFWL